jgi:hypothetical protein
MSYNLDRAEQVLQATAAVRRDSETGFLQGLLREIDPEALLVSSPLHSTTRSSAPTATCHSGRSCTVLGSDWMLHRAKCSMRRRRSALQRVERGCGSSSG